MASIHSFLYTEEILSLKKAFLLIEYESCITDEGYPESIFIVINSLTINNLGRKTGQFTIPHHDLS